MIKWRIYGLHYNNGLLGEDVRVLHHLQGRVRFTEYPNDFPEQTTLRQIYSIHIQQHFNYINNSIGTTFWFYQFIQTTNISSHIFVIMKTTTFRLQYLHLAEIDRFAVTKVVVALREGRHLKRSRFRTTTFEIPDDDHSIHTKISSSYIKDSIQRQLGSRGGF